MYNSVVLKFIEFQLYLKDTHNEEKEIRNAIVHQYRFLQKYITTIKCNQHCQITVQFDTQFINDIETYYACVKY